MYVIDGDFASIWSVLSLLNRLFALFLGAVIIKTLYSSAYVLLRLRSISALDAIQFGANVHELQACAMSLRQLHAFTLYLLWVCFALQAYNAYNTLDLSKYSVAFLILRNLQFSFACAAFGLFVLLLLHSLQWFVSARIHSVARAKLLAADAEIPHR